MVALVTDPNLEEQLIAQRRAAGGDRYDEVWDGVYVMSPLASNEHQDLVGEITAILKLTIEWTGVGDVFPGVNVSDRRDNWEQNYRCPDVAVFLTGTQAVDRGTHWFGGPDFAVEIVSPNDRTREKLPFYEKVSTRELLIIDRDPWLLTLYRLLEGQLVEVGTSSSDDAEELASEVIPLTWRLTGGDRPEPKIQIAHSDGVQRWTISPKRR